ncbi:uncharacterized protein LOC129601074 [Paramacrobiotus metropolitanus]|uniref:uncharacterized protein LOC129601074 n=1 Tax=Paramacrobiotus metropolitanus TaxID=2943436 RepID=UPI00244642AA|nr:uncharacterized protein LOC129601074 [Paramacrobiotus metropolitanus]
MLRYCEIFTGLLVVFLPLVLGSPLSYPGTSWVLAPREQDAYSMQQQQMYPSINQYNPNFIPRYPVSNPSFPNFNQQPPNFNQQRPPTFGGPYNNVDFGRRFPVIPSQQFPGPGFVFVGLPAQPNQPPINVPVPPVHNGNPGAVEGGGSGESPAGGNGSGSQENTVNTGKDSAGAKQHENNGAL